MSREEERSVRSFGFFDFIEIYDDLLKRICCAYSTFASCLEEVTHSIMKQYRSILVATSDQQFRCCRETPIFLRIFSKFHDQVAAESKAYMEMSNFITTTSVAALAKLAAEKSHVTTICKALADLQLFLSSSVENFLAVQEGFFGRPGLEEACNRIVEMADSELTGDPSLIEHLRFHNNYVMELCGVDAILDSFNNDIVPQITQKMNRTHRNVLSRLYSILDAQSSFFTQKSSEVQSSRQVVQTSVTRLLRWNHRREDLVHVCDCMSASLSSSMSCSLSCSPLRKRSLEIYVPTNVTNFTRIIHKVVCNSETIDQLKEKFKQIQQTRPQDSDNHYLEHLQRAVCHDQLRMLTLAMRNYDPRSRESPTNSKKDSCGSTERTSRDEDDRVNVQDDGDDDDEDERPRDVSASSDVQPIVKKLLRFDSTPDEE